MVSHSLNTIQKIVRSIEMSPDLSHALDSLVNAIHETLSVDVCSVYLTDTDNKNNVLMASYGLNPEAIGKVIIPFEEGLVGLVTQSSGPVNISHAPSHPQFKYIPDCGEEPFKSFMGVPITHHGEQVGVLVVQQNVSRRFNEQDLTFLSTLAAMIAGNITIAKAKGLINDYFSAEQLLDSKFTGVAGAPGIRIGTGVVIFHRNSIAEIPNRLITDVSEEETRFRQAIDKFIRESQAVNKQLGDMLPQTDKMLFEAYALIAGSEELINETLQLIRDGNWAPGALRITIESYASKFEALDDHYMRERANDIRNIGQYILGYLQKEEHKDIDYPAKTILVGENISPLDMAKVPSENLAGIVSGHGSAYSHPAILAHALGIPAVLGFSGQVPLNRLDAKTLVVDGYKGEIIVSPSEDELGAYHELIRGEKQLDKKLALLRDKPAITTDGVRIHLYTNIGLLADHTQILDVGTEGIGLYRTEFPFMNRSSFPSEEEQYSLYRQVIEAYAPKPVTIRILDAGGDKLLPYFNINEPNPFLGWRGIRLVLDHPEILLTQVRAMLRASHGYNNLKILLPMISHIDELDRAIELIQRAYENIIKEGYTVASPQIGVMIEVPSAIYQLNSIARRVSFLSVGTNDLIQYLLAIDRNNERVAKMFDPLHPSVLEALQIINETAKAHNKPLSICGEAASDPALVILLIAMKTDSLSVTAGDLPRIKWIIRTFSYKKAHQILQQVKPLENAAEIRQLLNTQLDKHGLGGLIRAGN